jgi:hypothetical protein
MTDFGRMKNCAEYIKRGELFSPEETRRGLTDRLFLGSTISRTLDGI